MREIEFTQWRVFFVGEMLTDKDVTEVSAAGSALYFDAMAIWIR